MDKKYIVSNWKMAPASLAEARQILDSVNDHLESVNSRDDLSLVFCPPFIFLEEVITVLKTSHLANWASLGAQDIFWEDSGSDTGEVSGPMLNKLGVGYVIVGHSERRWKLGESDHVVNKKLKAVLRNEMTPIICIGEKTRDASYGDFLKEQVEKTFEGLSGEEISKCIIAYEPVWAISSNPGARPDTPESALESIRIIRDFLIGNWKLEIGNSPRVLYGGSVNSQNVKAFLDLPEVSGVLIGSASVNRQEFIKILSLV